MTGRARIKEIASLANVGSATVDRVIHGRSHVSDATRQKVLQAKSAIESG
ncbi:LacI family DNA-binding transcriptional regulator, partial [Paracoccaceae bacterium]|nr:LacI family DNA-binding transcriptional regulator [Paracoccaceae bacterium]